MNPHDGPGDSPGVNDRQRVRELLPWYAQGSLSPPDQAFVERWLDSGAAAHEEKAELEWLRRTAAQLQAEPAASPALAEQGLDALMRRIHQEQRAGADAPTAQPDRRPVDGSADWREWLHRLWPGGARPSLVLASVLGAVAIVQAVWIGALLQSAPTSLESLGGPSGAPAGRADVVLLTVAFAPGSTEAAMRAALAGAQAQIVAGPSALGLYTVAVPAARADAAILLLRGAAGVVESVQR